MIAFLVSAAKIGIVLIVVVKKTGFPTNRTMRVKTFTFRAISFRPIGRKLMTAFTALILFVT